jgi:glutathione synthase/RimK-type ligase-like ATP-grasp enzyme
LIFDAPEKIEMIDYLLQIDIPVIGTYRYSKPLQAVILKKLGIPSPAVYSLFPEKEIARAADLLAISPSFSFILKMNEGARGLGQIRLEKQDLYELWDDVKKGLGVDELIPKYNFGNSLFRDEEEKQVFIDSLKLKQVHLSEFLEIKEEYRMIAFHGQEPIVIRRQVSSEGWQANSTVTDYGEPLTGKIPKEMQAIGKKLLQRMNSPWLSIDVYVDSKKRIGVFEFQMQMGYKKVPKDELIDKTNRSVAKMLKGKVK